MASLNYTHPSDQIKNVKGVVGCMRLAIVGLSGLNTAPTEEEIWGMCMMLDHINDRLDSLDTCLEKADKPTDNPAA